MKYLSSTIVISSLLLSFAKAQSPAWGQCGGQSWTGATTCVAGYTCTVSNPYYSQCLPGAASTSSVATITATTTAGSSPSGTTTPTTTLTGPTPTGTQIRSDQDPTFHLYLQNNAGMPLLGPENTGGYFTISGSLALNNADGTVSYLNVNETGTQSYKSLSFDKTATTTDWGLEGDTIITTNPRQLNFLTCGLSTNSSFWQVYLQEGNDQPSGGIDCSLTSLHLPCLC